MINKYSEKIPLTISEINKNKNTIKFVIQDCGPTTNKIINMKVNSIIKNVVGPLGNKSNITKLKKYVILIGGGVGIALIYAQIKKYKYFGNYIISIIGSKNKEFLFYNEEIKQYSNELFITTEDGSKGSKGYVTDKLKEILITMSEKIERVFVVGPIKLLESVVNITKKYENIEIIVSLNSLMIDGIGICGCCRVIVNKEIKYTCIDGPEFNGRLIDFDTVSYKNKMY